MLKKYISLNLLKYLFLVALLSSCSGITTERLLLTDVNSDDINVSEKYWLGYGINSDGDEELVTTLYFKDAGFFSKSKIWVAEMGDSKGKEKIYIRLKETRVKDKFIVQATGWNKNGKSETGIGILIKISSEEYRFYMPSEGGYDLAKNSTKLNKMRDFYSVKTGKSGLITFRSQAVELYSNDILDFLESMNLNVDLKLSGIFKATDKQNYNRQIKKVKI